MKKLLSFLLIFCVATAAIPAVAADGGSPVTVLAGADFQPADADHTLAHGAKLLGQILDRVTESHPAADGLLFAGDYVYMGYDNPTNTQNGLDGLKDTLHGYYPELDETNSVYVQGNHDAHIDDLSPSGANDQADYGVYVIHEDDYMNYNDDERRIKAAADGLAAYLNEKLLTGYDKPVFVVTHLPLHFSHRTKSQGDGLYARYFVDVMNAAGAQGLNIIFLFGHNHSSGYDDYLGGHAVYLAKGDQMELATGRDTFSMTTLNFTYMNAGYVSYYSSSGAYLQDENYLTMSVFTIDGDEVTIERYNKNGLYDLKKAGSFTAADAAVGNGHSANTAVTTSPQTISLSTPKPVAALTDPATGVMMTAAGLTGLSVAPTAAPALDADEDIADYTAYDIAAEDLGADYLARITLPLPADYAAPAVYALREEGAAPVGSVAVGYANGQRAVSFTAVGAGRYAVVATRPFYGYQRVDDWSDLTSGDRYLIVMDTARESTTNHMILPAVKDNGATGTAIRRGFNAVAAPGFNAAATVAEQYADKEWILTETDGGWTIGAGGQYAFIDTDGTPRGEVILGDTPGVFTFEDTGNHTCMIRQVDSERTWDLNGTAKLIYSDTANHYDYRRTRFCLYKRAAAPLGGDRAALDEAVLQAEALLCDGKTYAAATVDALTAALVGAITLPPLADQSAVDAAADAVRTAANGLRYLPGDVNGNGVVAADDALLALQAATGKIVLSALQSEAADVNGVDGVTAVDALMILQFATGKIDTYVSQ